MCPMYSWSHTLKTLWYEVRRWSHIAKIMGLTPDCFQYWFLNLPFLHFSYGNLKIVWYIRSTRFLLFSVQPSRAAHHPHCYSLSCSSENGTSELDSFTSTDEKKGQRGPWNTAGTMCQQYTSHTLNCSVYKDKNECYKQRSMKNGAPDNWSHKWKN